MKYEVSLPRKMIEEIQTIIGIILCTDKDNVSAEYALGGLSNQIFASTYTYIIPDKAKLIAQVETVLNQWND